jgi:hypothetical protein
VWRVVVARIYSLRACFLRAASPASKIDHRLPCVVLSCGVLGFGVAFTAHADAAGAPFCTMCVSTTIIAPELLVAQSRDLPGFARAKSQLLWTTFAEGFVHHFTQDTPAEAAVEIPILVHAGFQEGVENYLSAPHREADSETLVFSSPEGAIGLFAKVLSEDLANPKKYGVKQAPVSGVPGAVVFAAVNTQRHDAAGNVLFAAGRCLLYIGDVVHGASTQAQAAKAPVAATKPLYKRVRDVCA